MSAATLESALDFIASVTQQKTHVTFHGGEPLVAGHAMIARALEGLRARLGRGCRVSVQSNLWLLDNEYCDLFSDYGVSIGTSLDGPEHITDLQRGDGYFERTMAGIARARGRGLSVGCIATFSSAIADRWREVLDFFRGERIDFSAHAAVPSLDDPASPHCLTPASYGKLLGALLEAYVAARRELRIATLDEVCLGVANNRGRVCTFRDCLGMFLAIDPCGDIFSCQRLCSRPEYRLGSVAPRPAMAELLASAPAQRWRQRELRIHETCQGCEHFPYCRGGCPYNAAARGIDARDPYCEAYCAVFERVKTRMLSELSREENLEAIANEPWDGRGHPLARRGPLLSLMREDCHPVQVARHARRIVAAVEVAREPDRDVVAERLVRRGICRTLESARVSLGSLERRLHPMTAPRSNLYLHVTFDCQLHCTHCYAVRDMPGLAMTTSAVVQVLEQAHAAGFRQLVVTGGEPLLHPERDALLSGLRDARERLHGERGACWGGKPVRLVLRTNFALPLTEGELTAVASAFDQVVVSLDGSRKAHDRRRGAGSYDATVANLERHQTLALPSSRAELVLSAAISSAEFDPGEEDSVRMLAQRLGIRHARFRPLLPLGRAARWEEPPAMDPGLRRWSPLRELERGFWPTSSCGLGQNLYVDTAGEAFPCYAYRPPQSRLGNVLNGALEQVLESEAFRALSRHTVDTNRECRRCALRYLCGGACRAWCLPGDVTDLDAAVPGCDVLRKRAQRLLEVAEDYLASP